MNREPSTSFQDILKARVRVTFVGREDTIADFRHNLSVPPEDPARRFIYNVYGQGGVGKTTLLGQFRSIAEEVRAVSAWVSEAQGDVLQVMTHLADELDPKNRAFGEFRKRQRTYQQLQAEVQAGTNAHAGLAATAGRAAARLGLGAAKQVPVVSSVLSDETVQELVTRAGDWTAYAAQKLANRNDVQLVQHPREVLTPLFLKGLHRLAEKHLLALFFDTYEQTGTYLDDWLRAILRGDYGSMPTQFVMTIGGRDPLDLYKWEPFEALIGRVPLEAFTEEETKEYLSQKGVTDPGTIDTIWRASRGLPIFVAMLSASPPREAGTLTAATESVVDLFLKWEQDPQQRYLTLKMAAPRYFNRDIAAAILEDEGPGTR